MHTGRSQRSVPGLGGCLVRGFDGGDAAQAGTVILARLGLPDLHPWLLARQGEDAQGPYLSLTLHPACAQAWAPGLDTLGLAQRLRLDPVGRPADLLREIVVCMLLGPVAFEFPSVDELQSAVRIRVHTVQAARRTMLDFRTAEGRRPEDCWVYDEERGFVIRPGVSLIDALVRATQPEVSGAVYSFSCYRATEYVILLGLAQELARCNPPLYEALQALWATRPIKSGRFHDVFLYEQGSMQAPLPMRYFVPGDRTWFRNPDAASSEASGFEGSWVLYLGGGRFNNFWNSTQPYTLQAKCLEIYHWRHGLYRDAEGDERIDERVVAQRVDASLRDADETARILADMTRYREPRGVYTPAGGCMDTTREFARWVCPGTADLVLPEVQ